MCNISTEQYNLPIEPPHVILFILEQIHFIYILHIEKTIIFPKYHKLEYKTDSHYFYNGRI